MSQRSQYPAGVPCWVDTLQPDPEAAMDFYGELFGWKFISPGRSTGNGASRYHVATLRGREVAGIGHLPSESGSAAVVWNTDVAVASVEDSALLVVRAGGEVVLGPLDAAPAGRIAAVRDPTGAVLCLWEPEARQGRKSSTRPPHGR